MNDLTETQLAAIIDKVHEWTGRTIDADAVLRVHAGEWSPSHPVQRAILTAIDEVTQ
jgi:hypothetical protein